MRIKKIGINLEKKVSGLIVLFLSTSFIILGLIYIPWINNLIKEDHMEKIGILAENLKLHLNEEMIEGDPFSVPALIESFNSFKTVEKADVLKINGESAFRDLSTIQNINKRLRKDVFKRKAKPIKRILATDDQLLRRLLMTNSTVSFLNKNTKMRTSLFPVFNEESCYKCHDPDKAILGIVLIKTSELKHMAQIASAERKLIVGFILIMFISAFLLWLSIRKIVTSPILKIANSVKAFTKEGFEYESVRIDSNDEIGELAENFNQMTDTIKTNYQKLKDTEQLLHTVLENLGEGIMVVDKNFRIRMSNRHILNIVKMKEDEIIGKQCYFLMNGRKEICKNCPAIKTFDTGRPAFAHYSSITGDGSTMYLDHFSYPIFDSEGNVVQVIEKVVEISDRIKMEGQLRHAEKLAAVGMLASGVAHEVGNPLASISSLAQLIERESKDYSSKERAGLMKGYIDRIYNIVRNVLDFSRPDKGDLVDIDIKPIIESTVQFVKYDKRFKNIKITVDCNESLPKIRGIKERLHQVLMNLILNAADATTNKQNGRIDISTKQDKGFIVIEICDNGKGISRENQLKIFDPFFTTKKPGEGMGLGLFTSYRIIKSLGGKVEVESKEEMGTTFLLSLPVSGP